MEVAVAPADVPNGPAIRVRAADRRCAEPRPGDGLRSRRAAPYPGLSAETAVLNSDVGDFSGRGPIAVPCRGLRCLPRPTAMVHAYPQGQGEQACRPKVARAAL